MAENTPASDKKQRVLAAAEKHFDRSEAIGASPAIIGAHIFLGTELGMAPAEVKALLRTLHREGRIGLVSNGGAMDIARTQSNLGTRRTIRTKGGGTKRTSPDLFVRTPIAPPQPEPTEAEKLQAEVNRLAQLVQELQDKLVKSERHRRVANDRREEAREATKKAEGELFAANATIRRLQTEATDDQARIADLETQLKTARSQNTLAPEVANLLAVYMAKRSFGGT